MKVSLIVFGALAGCGMLRHRSAALRHWVLAAAVACAAAIPALQAVVPGWPLPFASPATFERYQQLDLGTTRVSPAPQRPDARLSDTTHSNSSGASVTPVDLRGTLRAIWIVGSVLSLFILIVGMLRLTWLAAHAQPVTCGRWREIANEISHTYGLRRPVRLLQTDHPSLLFTWGLATPKVILPAEAASWGDARVRIVLAHELAHIRRGDWFVQILAELLRAAYWFNPLVWITSRLLRLESERACDDEVMNCGIEGAEYANHLVEVARALNRRRHSWFPALAMARQSSLERRVRAMLNDRLSRTPISHMTRAAVFGLLLLVSTVVAAAQSGFSSLTGSVVDESGRGVPSTALLLVNEQRRMKYEVTSDELGRFEFVGLPAGSYLFEVRGLGFQLVKEAVSLAGRNLQRNITLKVGTLNETITVGFSTSDVAAVDQKPPTVNEVPAPARQACVASASGGQIVPPRKLRDVNPQYPAALKGTGTGGIVVMEARLGVDGYLRDIQIVRDAHPELAQAAIAAVREWRYSETLLNCVPVEVPITITTNFREMSPR